MTNYCKKHTKMWKNVIKKWHTSVKKSQTDEKSYKIGKLSEKKVTN